MKLNLPKSLNRPLLAALLTTAGLFGPGLVAQVSGENAVDRIVALLEAHSGDTFTDSTHWHADLIEALQLVYGNDELEQDAEDRILDFLLSDATYAAKKAVWREFANLMSERSLSPILSLVGDDSTSSLALLILQLTDLEDQDAIARILPGLTESETIGLLNHLGSSRNPRAADIVAEYLNSEYTSVVHAAFTALATTGTRSHARRLIETFETFPRPVPSEIGEAYLRFAERSSKLGYPDVALSIYQSLSQSGHIDSLQAAALFGMFKLSPDPATFVQSSLETVEPALKPDVIRMANELPESFVNGVSFFEIPGLSDENRGQLLLILAARNDPSIRGYAANLLDHPQSSLRMTALRSLQRVASINEVRPLFDFAQKANRDEEAEAMHALRSIPDSAVDRLLLAYVEDASIESKIRALQLLRERGASLGSDSIFQLTQDRDRKIQVEAIATLGVVGSAGDLPRALTSLIESESTARRSNWVNAVYRLALKNPNENARFDPVIQALENQDDPTIVRALLAVIGEYKDPAHYPLLKSYLNSQEPGIRSAALRAFDNWPNADPIPDLIELYRNLDDSNERLSTSRGILELMSSLRPLSDSRRLQLLGSLMDGARTDQEKIAVISGYGEVDTLESLKALVTLMKVESLRQSSEAAIREAARNVYRNYREPARNLLLEARSLSSDSAFRDWIDDGFRNQKFSR